MTAPGCHTEATTTRTGLRVHAELGTSTYHTGIQITAQQLGALPLHGHDWHGEWSSKP